MLRRHAWLALLLLVPAEVRAEAPPVKSAALAYLAGQIGQNLQLQTPAWVVVGPITTSGGPALDEATAARLHERLRLVVGSAVQPVQARSPLALTLGEARRQARQRGMTLVYLAPSLHDGQLDLTVDVVDFPRAFWQRARFPEGSTSSHLSLSAPADAEIRGFLPRGKPLLSKRESYASPLSDIVALGCGETPEGNTALVLVGRRTVVLGRFVGTAFVVEHQANWADLSPLSPTPLRFPRASASVGRAGIFVGSSDRAHVVQLDSALRPVAHGPRAYVLAEQRCAAFSATGIAAREGDCGLVPFATSVARAASPARDDASDSQRLGSWFSSAAGVSSYASVRAPVSGAEPTLWVRSPVQADLRLPLPGAGSALAMADLDGEGSLELIQSSSEVDRARDQLLIRTFDGTTLQIRAQLPLPGIASLTVCPFAGTNPLTLVVAAENRLWVFS